MALPKSRDEEERRAEGRDRLTPLDCVWCERWLRCRRRDDAHATIDPEHPLESSGAARRRLNVRNLRRGTAREVLEAGRSESAGISRSTLP